MNLLRTGATSAQSRPDLGIILLQFLSVYTCARFRPLQEQLDRNKTEYSIYAGTAPPRHIWGA
jgi:hypothetical protein